MNGSPAKRRRNRALGQVLVGTALLSAAILAFGLFSLRSQWVSGSGLTPEDDLSWPELIIITALATLCLSLLLIWIHFRDGGASRDSRYRAVVEQSPNGVLMVDASDLRIVDANPALIRTVGYSLQELRTMPLTYLLTDESADADALLSMLRDPQPGQALQLRQRCKNGSTLDVEVTGHRLNFGKRAIIAYTMCDVTVRRKIEAQLLEKQQHLDHLAHHDQLTGLPNRLYLAAHLPGAIEEARKQNTMLAVLFLDLDRFKHINDSHGHETGDKLLKAVARRVRATVRDSDIVVRMGGDEFIVILKGVRNPALINETAQRINEALSTPVIVDGRPLVTTVSIGVSLYPRDGADMGELLRHSDTAMYQAKDRGRNNFQLFSPVMDRKLRERVAIETSLRSALQTGQLDVFYQPIIDIDSRRIVALEALLRWNRPGQGLISPSRFISVAEDTGLIVPIGDFVMQRVIEDAARWRSSGATLVPIAMNISAVQLQRTSVAEKLMTLTRAHGISPELLQVELTESAMFERSRSGESKQDMISELRELGVRIAIDDFGTGYSSLSYLKRWRVDSLKIDRSFVRDLVTDPNDLAIVAAIIAIARHMQIRVVAEGIEGWQQLEKLRQLGCTLAQGYLFAKPTSAAQCRNLLSNRPLELLNDDMADSFFAVG